MQFIRGEPADLDFFQTHTALAKAIAQTIITNPLLRTIGLLGRWGSGKSTVLLQLEKELERAAPDSFYIFTYDAWLHQHDPVRRSFIEFAAQCSCDQPTALEISTYTTFWDRLPDVELTGNFQKAAKALGKDKGNRERIESIVMPKIEALSTDQWIELVQTGAEPYLVVEEIFAGKSLNFGKGSALFAALESWIPRLFASDRIVRSRWSALRLHLKEPARKALASSVAQAILRGQTPAELIAVLKLLGDELVRSPMWIKNADNSVSEVIVKLAGSKPGRAWLKANGSRAKIWIGKATPETRERFAQLLRNMVTAGTGEKSYWAEVCLRDWKL